MADAVRRVKNTRTGNDRDDGTTKHAFIQYYARLREERIHNRFDLNAVGLALEFFH